MPFFIRIAIAVLLFTASTLKAIDFIENYGSAAGRSVVGYGNLLVAQLELALSLLLFQGMYLAHLRKVLMVLFLLFAAKSSYSLWSGQASCGCLGNRVTVHPGVMLGIDLVAFMLLIRFPLARTSLWPTARVI